MASIGRTVGASFFAAIIGFFHPIGLDNLDVPQAFEQHIASSSPEMIDYYSEVYGVNKDLVHAIAWAESEYKNICNKEFGCSGGIGPMQIVLSTFNELCAGTGTPMMLTPHNAEDNIQCGILIISSRELRKWEPSRHKWELTMPKECSCIKSLREWGIPMVQGLDAKDLNGNTIPSIGKIVLFNYDHAALILSMNTEGFIIREANYSQCEETKRFIPWTDPAIKGFYDPLKDLRGEQHEAPA